MTILVTGGAGFIGSHVAKKLLERGDKVVIVDNFNDYYNPILKEKRISDFLRENQNLSVYRLDIADKQLLAQVFQENKIDRVCHLAAQAGVRYSIEHPEVYLSSNVIGTNNLLELCKNYDINHFIFASSSSVYGGNKKIPFSETDSVDMPVSLYAASKKMNELQAYVYHTLYGLNCFGLRFFTVYGPWGRPDMAIIKFAQLINAGKSIDVYNYGKHKRDFTYIDDIVDGIISAIDKCDGYDIFNLGNNQPVELNYLIELIEKELGETAKKNLLPIQPGDVPDTYANIDKAKAQLGFEPKIGIEEGIKKTMDWLKDYKDLV